ncbi:hypothetical protein B0H12DRAFT_1088216 [Mycena haematopus]|nr:hypothetical protein B0H12DRAFT_1088216 [Mycena haematopus]
MSERDKNTTPERNVERTTHAIVPIAAVTGTTRFCICIPTSSDARMSGSQANIARRDLGCGASAMKEMMYKEGEDECERRTRARRSMEERERMRTRL